MANILVTGSDGQLGQSLRLMASGSKHDYMFCNSTALDICDSDAVRRFVSSRHIAAIVNCAAFTDVERAETDPSRAFAVNRDGVASLARAAAGADALLVHISTDYVYRSTPGKPLTETSPLEPAGVYARSKLAGELAIAYSRCRSIILRTSWLFSEFGRNFVKTILSKSAAGVPLRVVSDQIGSPTYARDLAAAIVAILDHDPAAKGREGIYNFSNSGQCSWFDLASAVVNLAGHTGSTVAPCTSSDYPSAVRRPAYSVLDSTRFASAFAITPLPWTDALARCISNLSSPHPLT